MKNQFIPYEEALELKELGFDEECLGYYHTTLSSSDVDLVLGKTHNRFYHLVGIPEDFNTLAPLYQQAFRWFREKYNLLYTIEETLEDDEVWYEWTIKTPNGFEGSAEPTYEEAELACLKKLIEIVKKK